MTKSISFSLVSWLAAKIGEISEATKRWEQIQKIRVEAKTLEGIEFKALPEGREYLQLAFGNLFYGPGNEEFSKELSTEQLVFFDLISRAAKLAGFDMEIKKLVFHDRTEPVIHALLKPTKNLQELIGQRFEEQKALPPASLEFEKIFDFLWDETDLVAVKSRS